MKKIFLLTTLLLPFNLMAIENNIKTNCTKSEIEKQQDYFCLIKENKNYYVKEVLNVLPYKKDSVLQKSFEKRYNKNNIYKQYQRIQKINKIPEKLFKTNIKFNNENGLFILTTNEGDLYTTRSGYIQKNDDYLSIENNILESFNLEPIKNIKKVVAKYSIYALDNENNLWRKNKNEWKKVPIKDVYNFIYTDEGLLYLVSEKGFFSTIDKGKKENYKLKKIPLEISEELYSGKLSKEEYTNYVEKSLYNKNTKINYYFNNMNKIKINIRIKDINEKDFWILSNKDSIQIHKELRMYNKSSIHYGDAVTPNSLYFFNYKESDINVPLKYSYKYKTNFMVKNKNIIETKYNGNVLFNNKEKEIIIPEHYDGSVYSYEIKSNIVMSTKNKNFYFSLRDNGMLTIINRDSNKHKIIYNVNRIINKIDTVHIVVDKNFNHQTIYDINNPKDGKDTLIFKFENFKTLEEPEIKKLISPN